MILPRTFSFLDSFCFSIMLINVVLKSPLSAIQTLSVVERSAESVRLVFKLVLTFLLATNH